jgi:hypothetical protein
MLMSGIFLNISPARWVEVPLPEVIDRFTFSGWADQGSRVP